MRRTFSALAAIVLGSAPAFAQNQTFTNFIANAPLASTPFGPNDVIPVVQNGATHRYGVTSITVGMFQDASNATLPDARNNINNTPPTCYGYSASDGAINNGSANFSSATASFVAADATAHRSLTVAGAGSTQHANTVAIVSGGTGYAVYDEITIGGGTGTPAVLVVRAVNAGVITDIGVLSYGTYTVVPTNTISQQSTTGAGINATFDMTWLRDALVTTISSVSGPHDVVLAEQASATVTSAFWGYGDDNATAINAVTSVGGVADLPAGYCGIKSSIQLASNTVLRGSSKGGTVIMWLGPSRGGPLSTAGDLFNGARRGNIENITFDGLGSANTCLYWHGLSSWNLSQILAQNCIEYNADFDASLVPAAVGFFDNTISGLTLAYGASTQSVMGMRWGPGNSVNNVGFNRFYNLRILHKNQTAFQCGYADNNSIYGLWTWEDQAPGNTGKAIDFQGDIGLASCQGNSFYGVTNVAAMVARGGSIIPSRSNDVMTLQVNAPASTIETGAELICQDRGGNSCGSAEGVHLVKVIQLSNDAGVGGRITGTDLTQGITVSGGTTTSNGANIELYGSGFAQPSTAWIDADRSTFRERAGTTSTIVIDAANTHVRVGGSTAPGLSSCGTNPAIVGTDVAGEVTMGTGNPAGCVITFNTAYGFSPLCTVTWTSNLATMQYVVTNVAITLTQTATSSNKVNYVCMARNAG